MKRIIKHLIGAFKAVFIVAFTFLLFPFARLILWHKEIWVVSEFGYEARDNGYSFFKYMRKNHPEINCYYAIKKNSSDCEKVQKYGNVIDFGSIKHFAYWCAARYIISSKTQGFCPHYYLSLLRKKFHLWGKYIFLQHGITKDDQVFLYKKNAKIDLFICGAKPEYDDVLSKYGYKGNEIAYTGFSRFDEYFGTPENKQILVMPTWRRYVENTDFKETQYYKTWFSFVNSSELNNILYKHDLKLFFYLHPHFKEFSSLFTTKQSNIEILPFDSTDLQQLIRESKIFVTDFSSLAFDFGYMRKPVIYYQYDEKEYFDKHYIKGYFDYRIDGFGPVCSTFQEFLVSLTSFIQNSHMNNEKYDENFRRFFPIHDNKNCLRIFEAILKL